MITKKLKLVILSATQSFINDFPILSTFLPPRLTKINHKDGQVIQIGTIRKFWKSKLKT